MSSAAQTSRDPGEHSLAVARGLLATIDVDRAQESARRFLELPDAGVAELREGLERIVEASMAALLVACPSCRRKAKPGSTCPECGSKVPVTGHDPDRGVQFIRGAPMGPRARVQSPAPAVVAIADQGALISADTSTDYPIDTALGPDGPAVKLKPKKRRARKPRQKGKGKPMEEARVTGNPPVANSPSSQTGAEAKQNEAWGGPNASALTPAAYAAGLEMTEPPNLRRGEGWANCGNCVFYNRMCNLYGYERPPADAVHVGGYPVTVNDLCDSHTTLTPAAQQNVDGAQRYMDRYLREGRKLAEAAAAGDGFAMTAARARLDVARRHLEELGFEDLEEFWSDKARAAAAIARREHHHSSAFGDTEKALSKLKPDGVSKHNVGPGVNVYRDPTHGYSVLHHGSVVGRHGGDAAAAARHAHELASAGTARRSAGLRRNMTPRRTPLTLRHSDDEENGMRNELSEVKSDAYPGLDRSPKKNWVDKAGGLPRYIERIAKHLHYEKGKDIGHAIAIAVNVVKKMCASGDTNFPGKQSVNPKSRAQACAAVAQWEAKKAKSKAKSVAEAADYPFAKSLALFESAFKPIPPSWGFIESTLREIAEADGADWYEGLDKLDEAAALIDEVGLEEASELLEMGVLERLGHHFDPAQHPRARGGRFRDVLGKLERDMKGRGGARIGRFNKPPTQGGRGKTMSVFRGGPMPKHIDAHIRAGRLSIDTSFKLGEVPTRMQVKPGGGHELVDNGGRVVAQGQRGAVGHLWAANHNALVDAKKYSDPTAYAAAERSAEERQGRRRSRPSGADAGQGGMGRTASASVNTNGRRGPMRADPLGPSLAARFTASNDLARVRGTRQEGVGAPHDDLKVDTAIGQVLANFPNVKDWSIDGPHGEPGKRHWILDVELASTTTGDYPIGKKHKIRVDEDGTVTDLVKSKPKIGGTSAPKAKPAPSPMQTMKTAFADDAGSLPEYVATGDFNVISHMAPGTVYKGKDGHLYKFHGDDWMSGKKGPVKGAHVENLETGTHKTVPYFTIHGTEYEIHAPAGTFTPKPKGAPTSSQNAFAALMKSVEGNPHSVDSVVGKNVVVTGAIEGHTQYEVQQLIKAAGGIPHDKWHSSADILVTGEKVGKTKLTAASKKGIPVVPWSEFKHLVEAELGGSFRLIVARAQLEEATDPATVTRLRARVRVLEERVYDAGERRAHATIGGDRYPIGDKEHALAALERLHQGGLSNAEKAKVIAKAARYLPKGHSLLARRRKETSNARSG